MESMRVDSQLPEASQSLGRKIRLKGLLDQITRLDAELQQKQTIESLDEIHSIIKASDEIISEGNVEDRARHTTEVVMDAQLLKMNHELVSRVLQRNSDFNETLYQTALGAIVYRDGAADWDALANIVCQAARTLNVQSTMLGSAELQVRERVVKERQQRKRARPSEEKRPEEVKRLTRQDKGSEKVNIVRKQLVELFRDNSYQPLPYYKLIIDPTNLMNTVENSFQLSFLARDGHIAIETGQDGKPHVRFPERAEVREQRNPFQAICSLNMSLCQEMIEYYNIKKPMLNAMVLLENNEAEESDAD